MGLFKRKVAESEKSNEDIKKIGTAIRAVVTDVVVKRNGYIVMAIWEDRWLGTQYSYRSELLTQRPCVRIGGEVIIYVDDIGKEGRYYVDC